MSSKDLDDICSSDDNWDECMDVADNGAASQPGTSSSNVQSSNNTAAQQCVEMSEVDSPTKTTDVEMLNPSDDTEMKDLTTEPEDVGEMKSPSPTVEMLSPPAAVEMKDSEETELLNSPIREDVEPVEDTLIEDEALKSPSEARNQEEVSEDLPIEDVEQVGAAITMDSTEVEKAASITEETPTVATEKTSASEIIETPIRIPEERPASKAEEESNVEPEIAAEKSVIEPVEGESSLGEIEPESSEMESEKRQEQITATVSPDEPVEDNVDTEKSKSTETESKETPEKEPETDLDKPETEKPEQETEEKDTSKTSDERCESSDIPADDTTRMSDADRESAFDDESQCSADINSKDLSDIRRDNMEGVMVPGGADGDVNLEEETGDDPLGATLGDKEDTADKDDSEEILGDTSNDVAILPDTNKSLAEAEEILPNKSLTEAEEILPDTNKKPETEKKKIASDTSKKPDDPVDDKTPEKETPQSEGSKDKPASPEKTADASVTTEIDLVCDEKISEGNKTSEKKAKEVASKDEVDAKDSDSDIEEIKDVTKDEKKKEIPEIEVMEIDDDDDEEEEKEMKANEMATPREEECAQCSEKKLCKYKNRSEDKFHYICSKECYKKQKGVPKKQATPVKPRLSVARPPLETRMDTDTSSLPFDPVEALRRKCQQCKRECGGTESNLSWETMDFCNEQCLGTYQRELGSFCANCSGAVMSSSMGKYCVRFGFNVRQFCSSSCLEEFKKGLKVCSYCQRDITADGDGFLAPIGDKGSFKDFCSQLCMKEYEVMSGTREKDIIRAKCAVCCEEKDVKAEVIQLQKGPPDLLTRVLVPTHKLCSNPCLAAFKFANNLRTEVCMMCNKHYDLCSPQQQTVYLNEVRHSFCSKTCLNVNTLANRKIVACNWCKVKKYNFDMIRKIVAGSQAVMLCSLNCLALYQVSVSASSSRSITCDHCSKRAQGMYHLTMSDATLRNFCCYTCCLSFQSQFSTTPIVTSTPTPTGTPIRITNQDTSAGSSSSGGIPVISNVKSLATTPQLEPAKEPALAPAPAQVKVVQQVFVKPPASKTLVNRMTQCRPNSATKGVSCKPICNHKGTQTVDDAPTKVLIPVPVPIYVPMPMPMFSAPFPVPVPFPLPIPVPIFIPTTRNTAKGIRKEIKRIQEQIPRDPFEAELLMMAEMVAEDRPGNATSSDSDDDIGAGIMEASPLPAEPLDTASSPAHTGGEEVEFPADNNHTFGEDMLQMALKMASELTEPNPTPAMDLETALPAMPAPPPQIPTHAVSAVQEDEDSVKQATAPQIETRVTRKRGRTRTGSDWPPPSVQHTTKRTRTNSQEAAANQANQQVSRASNGSPPAEPQDPAIEVDPTLSLKYTYGVLAFRKWIRQKNSELLAKSGRAAKLFKTDILQLSTDELNFALCMFVKEVRKPDGEEYAPDIIYYLCLGIQLYLYRSHRIDNIFTDAYYEKFTESLNEITLKFVARLNDRTLVTRVEEEHLWESQQLGAHSPHVLLFTLMFFNTKHFLLTEVDDHLRLSFTHVMKHWKRNHAQPGKTGSTRNVLLRYYPPQSVLDADERKKKVYEQQENEANPLRCPVKLYEFYVSKCPESVRGRNDVFYLLPERSCVPDSPVWYSTMALPCEAVSKMLNRIRMVREVLSLVQSLNY